VRSIYGVAGVSIGLALVGYLLYYLVYPSSVVMFEALVWSIEAIAFSSVAYALHIASTRTVARRERYEVLRAESLASLAVAVIGILVSGFYMYKAVASREAEPTPWWLGLYPLVSAVVSFYLERLLHSRARGLEVRLVAVRAITSKLRYDVLIEALGGLAIILGYLAREPFVETAAVLIVSPYVLYGLTSLALEHLKYLVGPGPFRERKRIGQAVRRIALSRGVRVVRTRVESYGTFAEAEIWVEMPGDITLSEAHERARSLARDLIHSIPDLLRVVVVPVPSQVLPRRRSYSRRSTPAVRANRRTLGS